jgi:hypothetical protein
VVRLKAATSLTDIGVVSETGGHNQVAVTVSAGTPQTSAEMKAVLVLVVAHGGPVVVVVTAAVPLHSRPPTPISQSVIISSSLVIFTLWRLSMACAQKRAKFGLTKAVVSVPRIVATSSTTAALQDLAGGGSGSSRCWTCRRVVHKCPVEADRWHRAPVRPLRARIASQRRAAARRDWRTKTPARRWQNHRRAPVSSSPREVRNCPSRPRERQPGNRLPQVGMLRFGSVDHFTY